MADLAKQRNRNRKVMPFWDPWNSFKFELLLHNGHGDHEKANRFFIRTIFSVNHLVSRSIARCLHDIGAKANRQQSSHLCVNNKKVTRPIISRAAAYAKNVMRVAMRIQKMSIDSISTYQCYFLILQKCSMHFRVH
jgi:hypothetical protein